MWNVTIPTINQSLYSYNRSAIMVERLPHIFPFLPQILFTDIDDTLTLNGSLPVDAFVTLDALRRSGVMVVPVTGGSAGWCDCILRTWPVSAIIGENGALTMDFDKQGHLRQTFVLDPVVRRNNLDRLREIIEKVQAEIPEAGLTLDSPYRLTDIAFDIGQEQKLPEEKIAGIAAICRSLGANARASSIHINVWMGTYTKASAAADLLKKTGVTLEQATFVGDSPNDESMFEMLPITVGVANIASFLPDLQYQPSYITLGAGGLGFAELGRSILELC